MKRILDRWEFHDTPKHGSWLNMAQMELSLVTPECLHQRIPAQERLQQEVAAWAAEGNAKATQVDWRFTTEDARIQLQRLYPSILT